MPCVEQSCACGVFNSVSECELEKDDYGIVYNNVEFNGKCEDITAQAPCPFGQQIFPNLFGIGKFSKNKPKD